MLLTHHDFLRMKLTDCKLLEASKNILSFVNFYIKDGPGRPQTHATGRPGKVAVRAPGKTGLGLGLLGQHANSRVNASSTGLINEYKEIGFKTKVV
jgi:hypothetical protein